MKYTLLMAIEKLIKNKGFSIEEALEALDNPEEKRKNIEHYYKY